MNFCCVMGSMGKSDVTSEAMSGGKGVRTSEGEGGYERVVQSYWAPRVSQRSFLWRNCDVLRGFAEGLRGLKARAGEGVDWGRVKNDSGWFLGDLGDGGGYGMVWDEWMLVLWSGLERSRWRSFESRRT